jgi:RND family efflux transporter MFP subunit
MQFKRLSVIVLAAAILAGCGGTELEKKKKELADYKAKVKEYTGKVEKLEKEIAKLDTSFHLEPKVKLVQVEELKKQEFKHYIEVQGTIDADENVIALNQQPGIVTAVYVKVGDRVSKGQILGQTQTTAALEDQVRSTQTQVDLARTAFEKQSKLWEQRIGSEIQFLQAKTQKEAAEAGLAAVLKQVEMTKIIAPISGVVDAVNLRIGEMAAPSQLMPGIRIINPDRLTIKAKLADSDFGKIKQGDVVDVEFPDINEASKATVSYVSKTIDPRSRTFQVEIKLPGNSKYAANMVARLRINDAIYKNVVLVPTNTIQKSADGEYVLTAEGPKGKAVAHKNAVKTGASYNGRSVITEGLKEGQQIITFGYTEVVDGQKIDF